MIDIPYILNFFTKNPWLNLIFFLLAVIGIVFGMLSYFKTKKSRKPTYRIRTFNLIKEINKIDSVSILYKGENIENLSVSRIAIWNSGKETINKTDVAQNDRFRIEIDNSASILDYKLTLQKNEANGFKLNKADDNCIIIDFDYFDYNEGIIIELYHTATNSSNITLKGSFKGTKKIIRNNIPKELLFVIHSLAPFNFFSSRTFERFVGFVIIICSFIFVVLLFIVMVNEPHKRTWLNILALGCIPIMYGLFGFLLLKRRVPKGFNSFEAAFDIENRDKSKTF